MTMFTSRLIGCFRLAAVILLAAAIVLTAVASDGLARWLGVAGVLLLAAAVAGMVRGAGAFDERAFHRTRPGGERRVFVRQTLWLVSLPLAVGLVAVARGWCWNLGWRGSWTVGGVVFVLLLLCSVAVATGVVLGTGRSRRKFVVAWLMLGVPVAVYVWQAEMRHWQSAPLPQRFALWTSRVDGGVMIAAGGFCLAWWMAAGWRRWKTALAVAASAGFCLPMLAYRGERGNPVGDLSAVVERMPDGVTIKRAPLNQIAGRKDGARMPWNWLDVAGVGENEILRLRMQVPAPARIGTDSNSVDLVKVWEYGNPKLRSGTPALERMGEDLVDRNMYFSGRSHLGGGADFGITEAELDLLPGKRIENVCPKEWGDWFVSQVTPWEFEDMKRADWRISWEIVRPVHVGSVPVVAGGRLELPAGGVVEVEPARRQSSGIEVRIFEIYSSGAESGGNVRGVPRERQSPRIILVSGDGRRAWVLSSIAPVCELTQEGEALGSRWIRRTFNVTTMFHNFGSGWSTEGMSCAPGGQQGAVGSPSENSGEWQPEDFEDARLHVIDILPGWKKGRMVLPPNEP